MKFGHNNKLFGKRVARRSNILSCIFLVAPQSLVVGWASTCARHLACLVWNIRRRMIPVKRRVTVVETLRMSGLFLRLETLKYPILYMEWNRLSFALLRNGLNTLTSPLGNAKILRTCRDIPFLASLEKKIRRRPVNRLDRDLFIA